MKTKKQTDLVIEDVPEGQSIDIYYSQNVTINDNHGEINFKQTGKPLPPPPPPHGNQ